MKSGAIFDMDGLLFDTEPVYGQQWEKLAKVYGFTVSRQMMDELYGTNGIVMERIVKSYLPHLDPAELIRELFENARESLSKHVPVKPGAREILQYLKDQGVKIALASSSPLDIIERNLRLTDTASYFDAVVSGEHVTHGKPAPDIFLLAAEKLGLKASDCYVLEDGVNGMYAGIRAGCASIMVPDMVGPDDGIRQHCTGIFKSLFDVIEAMKEEKC